MAPILVEIKLKYFGAEARVKETKRNGIEIPRE